MTLLEFQQAAWLPCIRGEKPYTSKQWQSWTVWTNHTKEYRVFNEALTALELERLKEWEDDQPRPASDSAAGA